MGKEGKKAFGNAEMDPGRVDSRTRFPIEPHGDVALSSPGDESEACRTAMSDFRDKGPAL
jgi:hypothetical protein